MNKAQYLIAKYVPDLFRNEPVNIGVVVWIDGSVAYRFIGQRSDGTINGQIVRDRFRSLANYKQWVESWVRIATSQEVIFKEKKQLIKKTSPEFLSAMATHGRGNFILEQDGELLEDVTAKSIGQITDFLYERMVEANEEAVEYKTPEEVRDELLTEAEVSSDERVIRNRTVHVEIGGRKFNSVFSIYIGNGTPDVLAQMVPLSAQPKQVQNYALASTYKFLSVLEAKVLPQDRCVAFVYSQEDRSNIDLIQESITELSQVSTIVNISTDRAVAIGQIKKWVSSVKGHS